MFILILLLLFLFLLGQPLRKSPRLPRFKSGPIHEHQSHERRRKLFDVARALRVTVVVTMTTSQWLNGKFAPPCTSEIPKYI